MGHTKHLNYCSLRYESNESNQVCSQFSHRTWWHWLWRDSAMQCTAWKSFFSSLFFKFSPNVLAWKPISQKWKKPSFYRFDDGRSSALTFDSSYWQQSLTKNILFLTWLANSSTIAKPSLPSENVAGKSSKHVVADISLSFLDAQKHGATKYYMISLHLQNSLASSTKTSFQIGRITDISSDSKDMKYNSWNTRRDVVES